MKTKEKESKISPKAQKIIDIAITIVQVVVILIAITISAIVIANPTSSTNEVAGGSIKLMPVLSDSMDGADAYYQENPTYSIKTRFKAGDLVIGKKPYSDYSQYKVGDIITFLGYVNGSQQLITHRIVEIVKNEDSIEGFVTRGDANPVNDANNINPKNVLAVYKTHLKGVGSAINWLQDSTHFLLCVVIPLILLFIYNIILVVRMIVMAKAKKTEEAIAEATAKAAASAITLSDEEKEELKRQALEEMKKQLLEEELKKQAQDEVKSE